MYCAHVNEYIHLVINVIIIFSFLPITRTQLLYLSSTSEANDFIMLFFLLTYRLHLHVCERANGHIANTHTKCDSYGFYGSVIV